MKSQREAKPLLKNHFPFPLSRGRVHPEGFSLKGIKGMGLP